MESKEQIDGMENSLIAIENAQCDISSCVQRASVEEILMDDTTTLHVKKDKSMIIILW